MSKAKLSANDWEMVKDAPFWVNRALAEADGRVSFFTRRRENKALERAMNSYQSGNALVKDIIADESDASKSIEKASQAEAEKALHRIATVVNEKLGADDLTALSAFLAKVGHSVASASKEGGLGNAKVVSDKEAAALKSIEKALKVTNTGNGAQSKPTTSAKPTATTPAQPRPQAPAQPAPKPAAAAPVYKEFIAEHTVIPGDNLSFISEKYYGTQANFRILYEANKDVIGDNMNLIKPGQVLKIPKL